MREYTPEPADFSHWLAVRLWDSKEAAALLFGYEPGFVYSLQYDAESDLQFNQHPDHAALQNKVYRLEKLLRSAQLAGDFGKAKLNQVGDPWGKTVTATQWIKWAQRHNIECSADLLAAFEESTEQTASPNEELHPRTETTLLRIIGALLQEHMLVSNSSQAEIIRTLVDLHGHKSGISTSTLENYFADAKRRLDEW